MRIKIRGFWDSRGKRYSATLHVNGVDVSGSDGRNPAEAVGNLLLARPYLFGTMVLPVEEAEEPPAPEPLDFIPEIQYGC